jgi:hypothetical protein
MDRTPVSLPAPLRRLRAALAPLLALAPAGCAGGAVVPPPAPALEPSLPYGEMRVLGCHNCYERRHAETIEAALDGAHAIEIDIVDRWDPHPPTGSPPEEAPRTWFVSHVEKETPVLSNCGPDARQTLRDCLVRIRRWVDENPDAGVRIVFLDKKDPWSLDAAGRTPDDLDALLREVLGETRLVTPADLVGAADTSPRRALRRRGWPTMGEMRRHGAVLFVLTDATLGPEVHGGSVLPRYVRRLAGAAMWVAPPVWEARHVPAWKPKAELKALPRYTHRETEWVLFLNHQMNLYPAGGADRSLDVAPRIRKAGLVGRIWGDEKKLEERMCAMSRAGFAVVALKRFAELAEAWRACSPPPPRRAGG